MFHVWRKQTSAIISEGMENGFTPTTLLINSNNIHKIKNKKKVDHQCLD